MPEQFNLMPSSPKILRLIVADYLEENGDQVKAAAFRAGKYLPDIHSLKTLFTVTLDKWFVGNGNIGPDHTQTRVHKKLCAGEASSCGYGDGQGRGSGIDAETCSNKLVDKTIPNYTWQSSGSGNGDGHGNGTGCDNDLFCDCPIRPYLNPDNAGSIGDAYVIRI